MNKKYIDFVPADKNKSRSKTVRTGVSRSRTVDASSSQRVRNNVNANMRGVATARRVETAGRTSTIRAAGVGVVSRAGTQSTRRVSSTGGANYAVDAKPVGHVNKEGYVEYYTENTYDWAHLGRRNGGRSVPEIMDEDEVCDGVDNGLSMRGTPELGVIQDLNTKFVGAEVEKRPLGESKPIKKENTVTEAKSKRLVGRKAKKEEIAAKKSQSEVPRARVPGASRATYEMPKTPFINQGKVEKRPLSKSVYQKKVETPAVQASGPVTIITKPEKDKKVGMVITIIITIILGAAAGTVAFLLLPK